MAHSWLRPFFQSVGRGSRRRIPIRKSIAVSRGLEPVSRRLGFEPLERRILLTVTSSFAASSGLLTVTSNAADNIAIEINGSLVQINNATPGTGTLAVAAVTQLSISSGPGGGVIDLSQLVSGALPNLQSGQIQGSGATTLIAPLDQANTWILAGRNQGSLDLFTFQGVQNLTGGNQADAFTYNPSGFVSGTISEPAGGNVTLIGSTIFLSGSLVTQGGSVTVQSPFPGNSFTVSGSIDTQGGALTVYSGDPVGSGDFFTVSGSIYTQGGDLTVDADTIYLDTQSGPATISTRDLASVPGNQATDPSVGDSGNISLNGINITLGSATSSLGSANLYSQIEQSSQFTAGTIDLTASEAAGAGSGSGLNFPAWPKLNSTQTSITLNTAEIEGGTVTFTAMALSLHVDTAAPDSSLPATVIQTGIDFLQNFSIIGGLAMSSSQAAIDLGAASSIVASSFTATATATSDAETQPISIKLGVAIAIVNTTAEVDAAGHIATTGDITLDSGAINTLCAIANAGGSLAGAGAAVAIGVENSSSTATVDSTAQIRSGGDLTVQANTVNNKTLQAVTTTGDDGKVGVGVAVAYTNDATTAQLNGPATVGGDALVQANEVKNGFNGTKFFFLPTLFSGVAVNVGVGTDDSGDLLDNLQGTTTTLLLNQAMMLVSLSQFPNGVDVVNPSQAPVFQAAAGVAIDMEDNTASAAIGAGDVVHVAGNLSVDANTNDRPGVLASSGISQPANQLPPIFGSSEFDGSVAVALAFYSNTATATIDAGASVDVGKRLAVTSEALNDFQYSYGVNLFTLAAPTYTTDEAGANDITINPGNTVEVETNHTGNGTVGDWYQYIGAGSLTNVNLTTTDFSNTSLWNDLGPGWWYKLKNEVKNLTTYLDSSFGADNNLFDTWSQATSNNSSTDVAAAGSLTYETLSQTSKASIDQGAQINQDTDPTYRTGLQSVFVLATGTNSSLNAGGSVQTPGLSGSDKEYQIGVNAPGTGVQASDASIGAAVVVVEYTDDVTATICPGVDLYANSLDVDAETAVFNLSALISGGSSDNFGFIGVLSLVTVNNTTTAQIASDTSLDVGKSDVVESFPPPSAGITPYTTSAIEANALPGTLGTDASGDPTDTVAASTIVQAHDWLDLFDLAGGIMAGGNAGVGASVGVGEVSRDTEAYVGDPSGSQGDGSTASLTSGGKVIVDAKNNGLLITGALAAAKVAPSSSGSDGGGSGSSWGVGISGDVSYNQVNDTTRAYLHDANVAAAGLNVNAANDTEFVAVSGSVAIVLNSGTSAGIVGSYTENTLSGTTSAFLDRASLALTGALLVDAATEGPFYSISAGGSFVPGGSGIAVAGQVSINSNGMTTLAEILDYSSIAAKNNDISLTATNNNKIFAIAGALSYGGEAGIGAALATNTIGATAAPTSMTRT